MTVAADAAVRGQTVAICAPDYKRLTEVYFDLVAMLRPVKRSSSRTEGVIRTVTGGRIDFWTLDDESAGRSRKYHVILIDEGAFTNDKMMAIWERSLMPTLLDYQGSAWVLSNANGNDPDNFFYAICNQPKYGFVQYHAPSWNNPTIPAHLPDETEAEWLARRDEIFAKLRRDTHPLVFQQEYAAEFVDWSGIAFFGIDKLLAEGQPLPFPTFCEAIFAVIDSATKTGTANDGTAVVFYAKTNSPAYPLIILDWDLVQIEGAFLIDWLPNVLKRTEQLAAECGARLGSLGAFIEDKDSGQILLQAAIAKGLSATAIPSELTAVGKDERALKASDHVYPGRVKLSANAFNKTTTFKGVTRNHLVAQVTGFRVGDKDAKKRADDLLDGFTYGVCLGLGDADGL